MKKRVISLFTCLAFLLTLIWISPDSNAGIQTLNLSKQEKTIKVGESFQLTMTGVKASSIKWKSSKPGVATVSKKGVVKGIKAGTANITGKYKGLKFTIKVVVSSSKSSDQSKPTKSDKLIFSDSSCDFYYTGITNGYKNDIQVNFKVINKLNKTAYWAFDIIYFDGIKQYDTCCDNAMPNMECSFYVTVPKDACPKEIKGILYSWADNESGKLYSREFSYTIK